MQVFRAFEAHRCGPDLVGQRILAPSELEVQNIRAQREQGEAPSQRCFY